MYCSECNFCFRCICGYIEDDFLIVTQVKSFLILACIPHNTTAGVFCQTDKLSFSVFICDTCLFINTTFCVLCFFRKFYCHSICHRWCSRRFRCWGYGHFRCWCCGHSCSRNKFNRMYLKCYWTAFETTTLYMSVILKQNSIEVFWLCHARQVHNNFGRSICFLNCLVIFSFRCFVEISCFVMYCSECNFCFRCICGYIEDDFLIVTQVKSFLILACIPHNTTAGVFCQTDKLSFSVFICDTCLFINTTFCVLCFFRKFYCHILCGYFRCWCYFRCWRFSSLNTNSIRT